MDNNAAAPQIAGMVKAHPSTTIPSTPRPRTVETAVRDADWLAHRYDPTKDAVHFIPVPRATHDALTFLTDDHLPAYEPFVVGRPTTMAAAPKQAPLHFLFHSAYCCSTLLARALNRPGWAMGLKEPVILNDIIGWRRRGGQGPDMASVLDDTLTLLSRPFAPGEAVVVKPSTVVNGIAAAMMTLRPQARAVLLYAPLPTYLASIAKKGLDGRLWVRTLLTGMIDDGLINLGFSKRDHLGQTDLQVAAIGWLAHQMLFAQLVERFGVDRVRTLDSATLMANPRAALSAIAQVFGLASDPALIDAIAEGPAFRTHSKFGTAFDATHRAAEHRDAAALHADEIEKVTLWAEAVAASAGFSTTPPAPLID